MKSLVFAKRNFKEIVRDPVNLVFLLALPLFLLVLFQQFNIPNAAFEIKNFAPSIVVFSFGFISLFSAQLIAKDRDTAFLSRLYVSPLKVSDYIIGYVLSLLPLAFLQSTIFLFVGLFFGLDFGINIILTIIVSTLISLIFIGLGLLIGCFCTDRQAPGVGSIVIQLIAFTSGMWFDTSMVSKVFSFICNILPFKYTIDIVRAITNASYSGLVKPILIVLAYTLVIFILSILIFKHKKTSDDK